LKKITLPEKELLTPGEVADYFSVSSKTVYSWCGMGMLLCTKLNGTLRIFRTSVIAMRDDNTQNGDCETPQKVTIPVKKRRVLSGGF
jgi:hypothetical protein